jgi:type I restriction enzyme, S subunit
MSDRHVRRYAAYKESGVEWLREVPAHWVVKRLKELGKIQNSNVDKKTHPDEKAVRLCNYVDVYKNEFINSRLLQEFMLATADESEIKKFAVKQNDVLITKDSETADDIATPALVTETLTGVLYGYHLAQIRTNSKKIFGPYLFRLFQSNSYNSRFEVSAKGITRVGLGQSALSDALTPVPPHPEQTAIAAYLDTKTAQIDRQIELLSKKAMQYGKLKQSLINETVTRGLNSSVPMKESGVEWIGEVPAHWEVTRVNDIAKQNKNKNFGLNERNLLSLSYGRIIRKDFNTCFGLLPDSFETYQVVKPGAVILRLTDLQNDWRSLRVGLVSEQGIITSAYLGLIFHNSINASFAYYLLHVYDLCKVFYWFGGGLRSTMRFDDIKIIPFVHPSLPEQTAIAAYLDMKTAQIDRIVITINTQIDKLKELRKTLINDVVTGKIKVIPHGELA